MVYEPRASGRALTITPRCCLVLRRTRPGKWCRDQAGAGFFGDSLIRNGLAGLLPLVGYLEVPLARKAGDTLKCPTPRAESGGRGPK